MRVALALIIAVLAVSDALALDLSLMLGLSVKNAVLYLVAGLVLVSAIMRGGTRLQMGTVQACFATLIVYASLTMLFDAFVIHLPHYRLVESAIQLKTILIDSAIIFAVFFYGLRSANDAQFVIKCILAGVTLGNIVSIADVAGIIKLGITSIGVGGAEEGRVFGAFGHANDTALLIVTLLPAYGAAAFASQGFARFAWIGAALVSVSMFMLTGSRGGFLALVLGGAWGALLCRRYVSARIIAGAAAALVATLVILLPIVSLVGTGLGSTAAERMLSYDSSGGSGRTDIWMDAIGLMIGSPVAVVTGFGWNSWFAKGFFLAAHNQYLWLWFELGIVGVAAYLGIVWQYLSTARFAIDFGSDRTRPYLIAFVFGSCMLTVATVFTLGAKPWPYIWAYVGAACRIAVDAINAKRPSEVPATPSAPSLRNARFAPGVAPRRAKPRDAT